MRSFSLALSLGAAAILLASPASAQDSALVRYADDLARADRLLPLNRRDYFETGARLTAWTQALASIAAPAALASSIAQPVATRMATSATSMAHPEIPRTSFSSVIARPPS